MTMKNQMFFTIKDGVLIINDARRVVGYDPNDVEQTMAAQYAEVLRQFCDTFTAAKLFQIEPSDANMIFLRSELFTGVALAYQYEIKLLDVFKFLVSQNCYFVEVALRRGSQDGVKHTMTMGSIIKTMTSLLWLMVDVERSTETPRVVRHWNFTNLGLKGCPVTVELYKKIMRREFLDEFSNSTAHPFRFEKIPFLAKDPDFATYTRPHTSGEVQD